MTRPNNGVIAGLTRTRKSSGANPLPTTRFRAGDCFAALAMTPLVGHHHASAHFQFSIFNFQFSINES
jgi:hypothetical protein